MRSHLTRREAMKLGLGIAAGASVFTRLSHASPQTRPAVPIFQAFVTDQTGRRHARLDGIFDAGSQDPVALFSIDPSKPLQEILGFGAALTEAACTVLGQLTTVDRASLLEECYTPLKTISAWRVCALVQAITAPNSIATMKPRPIQRFPIQH